MYVIESMGITVGVAPVNNTGRVGEKSSHSSAPRAFLPQQFGMASGMATSVFIGGGGFGWHD